MVQNYFKNKVFNKKNSTDSSLLLVSFIRAYFFFKNIYKKEGVVYFVGPLVRFNYIFSFFNKKSYKGKVVFISKWVPGSFSNQGVFLYIKKPKIVCIFSSSKEFDSLVNECKLLNIPVMCINDNFQVNGVYNVFLNGSKLEVQFFVFYMYIMVCNSIVKE